MLSVIEELTEDGVVLDAEHLRARIVDWRMRIDDLYREIADWFPHLGADRGDTTVMDEPVMRAYGVPPIRLPVLRLSEADVEVGILVPRGLWIIGVNGRVDLSARNGQFLIIDRSGLFAQPRWTIAPALDRLAVEPLSRTTLAGAIQ
ncbi:hypothetical protein [Methylobacterium platani]|uniref:Uncharacterized protein n=2 Tax=Methylobacterium platani TaxID=427683 RepID=A0A179SFB5_9HYPH|nr:hypothetical protein [Methylobacterium platani]KMO14186.1 hypothetical protein SQ03_20035 [Methylobacterium platani JCM 14648]OAS26567.1 hypothetical protein A5481_05840 [Methylobacterium platani]